MISVQCIQEQYGMMSLIRAEKDKALFMLIVFKIETNSHMAYHKLLWICMRVILDSDLR